MTISTITFPTIVVIVGVLFIIISFFMKNKAKKIEKDVEELSLTFYEDMNQLRQRVRTVEEELMLDTVKFKKPVQIKQQATTPMDKVNQILISQVLTLHDQGFSIEEIEKRSALSAQQIEQIIRGGQA